MSYLLTPKAIKLINDNLNIKLNEDCKDFNVLIYTFENYNEIINYKLTLDFFMLLKFYGHNEIFMVLDFIKYLTRKALNGQNIILLNPFINNNYSLFSDIVPNNLLNKLEDISNNYKMIINDKISGIKVDYMLFYNNYLI